MINQILYLNEILLSINILVFFGGGLGTLLLVLIYHFTNKNGIHVLTLIKLIIWVIKVTFFPLIVLLILCKKMICSLMNLSMQIIEKPLLKK